MSKTNTSAPGKMVFIVTALLIMLLTGLWVNRYREESAVAEKLPYSLPAIGWYRFHNVTDSEDPDVTYKCIFKNEAMRCDGINPSNNQPTALLASLIEYNASTLHYQSGCENCLENTKETYLFQKQKDGSYQITGRATASYIGRTPPKNFTGVDELSITYLGP